MLGGIYKFSFATSRSSPQKEDQSLSFGRKFTDNGICKRLPTHTRMTECLMCSDRKTSVEQEYSLLGPSGKISTCGDRSTCLGLYLLKNIPQRRRKCNAITYGKAQSMSLTIAMIRVLAKNDYLYIIEGSLVKGIKNLSPRRKASGGLIFLANKIRELKEVWFLKLRGELGAPTLLHTYFFHVSIIYLIRHLPVISSGCSRPMMCKMLGATSANTPSSTFASLLAVT